MKYKLENGKEINIPDADIKNYMKTLDLTEEEAIEMYLDDEGYTENDEVEELTKKAKENKNTLIAENSSFRGQSAAKLDNLYFAQRLSERSKLY